MKVFHPAFIYLVSPSDVLMVFRNVFQIIVIILQRNFPLSITMKNLSTVSVTSETLVNELRHKLITKGKEKNIYNHLFGNVGHHHFFLRLGLCNHENKRIYSQALGDKWY